MFVCKNSLEMTNFNIIKLVINVTNQQSTPAYF